MPLWLNINHKNMGHWRKFWENRVIIWFYLILPDFYQNLSRWLHIFIIDFESQCYLETPCQILENSDHRIFQNRITWFDLILPDLTFFMYAWSGIGSPYPHLQWVWPSHSSVPPRGWQRWHLHFDWTARTFNMEQSGVGTFRCDIPTNVHHMARFVVIR